MGLRIKRTD